MARTLSTVALGDQLADILRLDIVQGAVQPGARLVEDDLAAEHGVSRGPVRDALRTLAAEGLLESRQRGVFVKPFTVRDIDELYDIREAAEQLACRLSIARATRDDWSTAERLVDRMKADADAGDRRDYARADLAFHTEFYALSGNGRLLALWQQFQPTFATLLDITNAQDVDLRPSADDHDRLMQLLLAGDTARLSTALTSHLAGSRRRMAEALSTGAATRAGS